MLKILLVIASSFCLSLISCAQDIVGVYFYAEGIYAIRLTLHEDSTFTYEWGADVISTSFKVEGDWHYNNNELILNGHDQPVIDQQKGDCDSITIKVVDDGFYPIIGANVILKSGGKQINGSVTYFDGKATLRTNNADSLFISYTGFQPVTYPLDTSMCYLEFRLYEGYYNMYITDQVYTIQGDAICPIQIEPDQSRCLVKEQ